MGISAWRPGHVSPSQQMHVEVADGLAAVGACVDDESVARCKLLLLGDLGGGDEELAEQFGLLGGGVGERAEVLLGDDENVRWGLRVDVGEGEQVFVLEEMLDGDGSGGDVAEEAVHRQ